MVLVTVSRERPEQHLYHRQSSHDGRSSVRRNIAVSLVDNRERSGLDPVWHPRSLAVSLRQLIEGRPFLTLCRFDAILPQDVRFNACGVSPAHVWQDPLHHRGWPRRASGSSRCRARTRERRRAPPDLRTLRPRRWARPAPARGDAQRSSGVVYTTRARFGGNWQSTVSDGRYSERLRPCDWTAPAAEFAWARRFRDLLRRAGRAPRSSPHLLARPLEARGRPPA